MVKMSKIENEFRSKYSDLWGEHRKLKEISETREFTQEESEKIEELIKKVSELFTKLSNYKKMDNYTENTTELLHQVMGLKK